VLTREDARRVDVVLLRVVDLRVVDILLLLVDDDSSSVLDGVSVSEVHQTSVVEGDGVMVDAQVQDVAFEVIDGTPLEGPTGPVGVSTTVVPLGGL
jgi:hypothetical protein